jgi:hypothetical protein
MTAFAVCLLAIVLVAPRGIAASEPAADPSAVAKWDAIAFRTVALLGASAQLYQGITSAAVYNAVVTIDERYEEYVDQPSPKEHASPEVAVAAAAFKVLRTLFPEQGDALRADYDASLAAVPDGAAKVRGDRVGRNAARAILQLREDDGRNDPSIPSPFGTDPGQWPGAAPNATVGPMAFPWLGFVDPLTIESPTQFSLHGPDALDSAAYAADLAEVQAKGAATDSTRTAAQTRNAWFYSDNVIRQHVEARALLIQSEGLDIVEAARMNAVANMSAADAAIACWRAKYDHNLWRPFTAIRTTTDPNWNSLIPAPPYPDYTSGHACLSGAYSESYDFLFPDGFELVLKTAVPGAAKVQPPPPGTVTTRIYTDTDVYDRQTMNARIQLGIHFRRAMTDGNALGHRVAAWALDRYFEPES